MERRRARSRERRRRTRRKRRRRVRRPRHTVHHRQWPRRGL